MTQRPTRAEFFQVVEVVDNDRTRALRVAGASAVVVGITESEELPTRVAYAVMIEDLDEGVMLMEDDVRLTDRRVDPSEIYDGTTIRVSETGQVVEGRPSAGA